MLGCIERGYSMSFSGILCRNDSTGKNLRKILQKILIPMVKRNFFLEEIFFNPFAPNLFIY